MITSARLAVVSGGATGIGREIARAFASHGDRVVIMRYTTLLFDGGSGAVRAGIQGLAPEGNPPDLSVGIVNGYYSLIKGRP